MLEDVTFLMARGWGESLSGLARALCLSGGGVRGGCRACLYSVLGIRPMPASQHSVGVLGSQPGWEWQARRPRVPARQSSAMNRQSGTPGESALSIPERTKCPRSDLSHGENNPTSGLTGRSQSWRGWERAAGQPPSRRGHHASGDAAFTRRPSLDPQLPQYSPPANLSAT